MRKPNQNMKIHQGMIRVPAGPFRYGEQREERGLPEFWVDCAPVTNAARSIGVDVSRPHR
jgi:formylglycine-generating enzyme required for sulfatase activity